MRFVFPGGATDWALVEPDQGIMRHLAGGLAIWAPRIAYGEGRGVLPLNGRVEPWRATAPLCPGRHYRRVFPAAGMEAGRRLAALVGAAPMGCSNPLRCIVGYVAVTSKGAGAPPVLGPILMTAKAFGAGGPVLARGIETIADQLASWDRSHGLRTGDAVILGPATLSPDLWAALCNTGAAGPRRAAAPGP